MNMRNVQQFVTPHKVLEGDGVPVVRYFKHDTVEALDPFLMLDVIRLPSNAKPLAGFPWHPHAGQTTFSYVLHGTMEHEDTLGNRGSIGPGGAQYMEAASGIAHQEMPSFDQNGLWAFQLWINLDHKARREKPTYQNIDVAQIPVQNSQGVQVKVVAGPGGAVQNPCRDLRFLDVSLSEKSTWEYELPTGLCAWILVLEGKITMHDASGERVRIGDGQLVKLTSGIKIHVHAEHSCRFLCVAAEPVQEPVFWYGPFVARTREEIAEVVDRYKKEAFGKVPHT